MWDRMNKFVHSHVIISACILSVIFSPVLAGISILAANMTSSGRLTVFTIVKLVLSVIVIWLMRKMQVFNINDFNFDKTRKGVFLTCVGSVFAIIGLLYIFVQLPENRFIAPNLLDFLIVALSQLIGVGIFEEVLYRGLVLKILLKKLGHSKRGIINACVISSVIFGMVHITNIVDIAINAEHLSVGVILPIVSQIIFATAFGLLVVALFLRSGTLWIPILIHGVGNLVVQTFVAFISRDRILQFVQTPVEMSAPEFIISTLMSTIPLLVAGLVLLRKVKPDEIPDKIPEHS